MNLTTSVTGGKATPNPTPETDTTTLSGRLLTYDLDHAQFHQITDELINLRLKPLCKKYCFNNRYQYYCTIDPSWGQSDGAAAFCEWGNASYSWFLEELSNDKRLEKVRGETSNAITRYFSKIVHSIAFLERFKNWRFQRRIRVPDYIKAIDIDAHKIFWGLCDQDTAANIAQRLGRKQNEVSRIITRINQELARRNKNHLLNLTELVSLTGFYQSEDELPADADIPSSDMDVDQLKNIATVKAAYSRLTWLEQFVLDSMIVDELSAKSVLETLINQNISVDERIEAADQNIQHLYYFFRKTLTKLKQTAGFE